MKAAPVSVLHTIADHYKRDASDFLERFNILWERQLHKTGRIKSFVELLLACECILKCHIILQEIEGDPRTVYKKVRSIGHNIEALAKEARYLNDRSSYAEIESRLGSFSILVRYSLDAYETFFPSALEGSDAPINHSATIGNNPWVLATRDLVTSLINSTTKSSDEIEFVTDDLEILLQHELEMKKFAEEFIR